MELRRKLTILADAAKYDASCASSGSKRATPSGGIGNTNGMGILPVLRSAVDECRACDLHAAATQAVFGIGPAGRVLDRALAEAGIARSDVYVTNAVKHFKFESKSERRLHKRPRPGEVRACRAWLDAELSAVKPRVIVCLGNTAAQSFSGARFNLLRYRGKPFSSPRAEVWLATWHPSLVLRTPPGPSDERFAELVADLRTALELSRGR